MYKIFDVHTHTYPELIAARAAQNLSKFYNFSENFDFDVEGTGTVDDLMEESRQAGISGFLILGVATNARQVPRVNEAIAADVKRAREAGFAAFGYAAMHQNTTDFSAELDYALSLGLTGAKIHPDIQGVDIDDERFFPLYRELCRRGIPLYLHMGDDREEYQYSQPKKLAFILDMFPELTVFAAHLGGYKSWDAAVTHLAGRPNVYYDTSSAFWAMTTEYARELIYKLGVENIMFGTDYPVLHSKGYLDLFMNVELPENDRRAILWDNAARFFSLND